MSTLCLPPTQKKENLKISSDLVVKIENVKKNSFFVKKSFFSKMYALKFYLSPQIIQNITVPFGTLFCVVLGLNNDFCSFHHFRPKKFEILKFVILAIFCPPPLPQIFVVHPMWSKWCNVKKTLFLDLFFNFIQILQ